MSRFENDQNKDREQDRERERESERERMDKDRGRQQYGANREGSNEPRRSPDIGRSNEYGSHAGWGGQGFNQGSFGNYGGQGEQFYTQHGGQGFGAEHGYSGRETGGGMSTYQGPRNEQSGTSGNYERGRGSEREGSQGAQGQGSERPRGNGRDWETRGPNPSDAQQQQRFSGQEGGWGGYGSYDRERVNRGHQAPSGSQGWVGGQLGYGPGSTSQSSESRGRHYGRGPKGWQRSDERIREDVSERLSDHPDIDASDIEVEVKQGEVILKGTVKERHAKRLAEDVAEGVSGVRDVQNQIRVDRGVWGAIKDAFTGDSEEEHREGGYRDRSAQPQSTSDTGSTSPITSPTHTVTPAPNDAIQTSKKENQPATARK